MALRRHPRRAGGRVTAGAAEWSTGEAPQTTAAAEEPDRPTAVRVWHWTESVVLGGYGPSVSSFL
ncbi:hypothetical protein [Streptomyces violaceorubidus]|uniref:Uncharacterized protein n=1 Tax=Streptomyces violaceorubidus TaxID=284042 RepID=A0ABV1SV10_9ACTN